MQREALVTALAAVFAAMAAVVFVIAVVFQWGLLFIAIPLGVTAGFMWYQASGRLRKRVRRRVNRRNRAGVDATTGPRGATATGRTRRGPGGGRRGRDEQRHRRRSGRGERSPFADSGMSRSEAASVLGVDPTDDEDSIQSAYRSKVKSTHPDTADGDEEAFKRVNTAYETLSADE